MTTREEDRLRRRVEAWLGEAARLHPAGNPDGEARVWRVDAAGPSAAAGLAPRGFLKVHRVADKWRRERALLERLAEPPAAPVPALLAADPDALALLVRARPGVVASSRTWSPSEQRALHEQAGAFRRRLDAVPVDDDDLPLAAALPRRLRAWLERARPSLPDALLRAVEASFDARCFEGTPRRWSHRDFAPHNWIVEPTADGPRLSVIDFGQARPDAWLVDVLELWDGPWAEDPALAEAFWRGYGRRPSPAETQQLRQLALLRGLATATWGDRHRHDPLSRHGRALLTRALALPLEASS